MKYISLIAVAFFVLLSCNGQVGFKNLTPAEFAEAVKDKTVQVLDVRTTEEYDQGFIANSKNIDINADGFEKRIETLDKSKPVYVYCLSGGRSANATKIMIAKGFTEVYNLTGGIMKWKYDGMPIVYSNPKENTQKGMSLAQYKAMLKSKNKPVLVEFYATWCIPCKTLKPKVEEIGKEYASQVEVVTIDVDKNKELADSLRIESIPLLIYYKGTNVKWKVQDGAISKASILKKMKL